MITNKFDQPIYTAEDLCNLIMQGKDLSEIADMFVSTDVDIDALLKLIESPGKISTWKFSDKDELTISEFDTISQNEWFMPQEYQQIDIAEYILTLCKNQDELQRCGQELLLFQERNLLGLLKYLKYLVDVMNNNKIIWGVGRGSSVASYVLYKLGVHKIDSLFYDLDPMEFLR